MAFELNQLRKIILDAHNDTMMKAVNPSTYQLDTNIGESTDFDIDLNKMTSAGVDLLYFAAFTDDLGSWRENHNAILASLRGLKITRDLNSDRFRIPMCFSDVISGIEAGVLMGIHSIEGAYAFTDNNMIGLLKQYDDLGVKVIAPVWNHSNSLGEGTLEKYLDEIPSPPGLTKLGRSFVGAMNHLGIIIDVSHMNDRTFWDTVKTTTMPIIASHSGVYALREHVRNLKDDQIKAIAETGGVINVVFCRNFLGDASADVSVLVDHIEYIIKLVGVDHVGLGSDFDGATMPVGLKDLSEIGKIEAELRTRGYDEADLKKIMGHNNLRVLKKHDDKRQKQEKIPATMTVKSEAQDFKMINQPVAELTITLESPLEGFNPLDKATEYLDLPHEEISYVLDGLPVLGDYDAKALCLHIPIHTDVESGLHVLTVSYWDDLGTRHYFTDIFELK